MFRLELVFRLGLVFRLDRSEVPMPPASRPSRSTHSRGERVVRAPIV